MNETHDNYWIMIPPKVAEDTHLSHGAKLLFGRIYALSNKEGFCFASNDYLGKSLRVKEKNMAKRTVSFLVAELLKRGHIKVQIVRNHLLQVTDRRIYIDLAVNILPLMQNSAIGIAKIGYTPIAKIGTENNIYINKALGVPKALSSARSVKCPNSEGHKACAEDLKSLEENFQKKFPSWDIQLRYYHLILRAGYSHEQVEHCINVIDSEPFYQEEGWDLQTVYKKLSKGGEKYGIREKKASG